MASEHKKRHSAPLVLGELRTQNPARPPHTQQEGQSTAKGRKEQVLGVTRRNRESLTAGEAGENGMQDSPEGNSRAGADTATRRTSTRISWPGCRDGVPRPGG